MSIAAKSDRVKMDYPRDGENVADLWKIVLKLSRQVGTLSSQNALAFRAISSLKSQLNATTGLHPFKIYQLPPRLRTAPDDGQNWQRVRIRTGGVIATSANQTTALTNVAGTDGATNPDIETYMDNPSAMDIVVPAGEAFYYFWVTLDTSSGTPAATLYYGTSPATASPQADTWATFPEPDSTHRMIGWVDSLTLQASQQLLWRQIAREDLDFSSSSPAVIHPCTFVQAYQNYIIAKDTVTGKNIQVAKPYLLMQSRASETIDGTLWTLAYNNGGPANQCRAKSNSASGYSENQRITPEYCAAAGGNPGSLIYAEMMSSAATTSEAADNSTPTGTPIFWQDCNEDARAWARTFDGNP